MQNSPFVIKTSLLFYGDSIHISTKKLIQFSIDFHYTKMEFSIKNFYFKD